MNVCSIVDWNWRFAFLDLSKKLPFFGGDWEYVLLKLRLMGLVSPSSLVGVARLEFYVVESWLGFDLVLVLDLPVDF